jgi:hypothetical protein
MVIVPAGLVGGIERGGGSHGFVDAVKVSGSWMLPLTLYSLQGRGWRTIIPNQAHDPS